MGMMYWTGNGMGMGMIPREWEGKGTTIVIPAYLYLRVYTPLCIMNNSRAREAGSNSCMWENEEGLTDMLHLQLPVLLLGYLNRIPILMTGRMHGKPFCLPMLSF